MFEQWNAMNKGDFDSESNPSEDELTAAERKLKGVDREKKTKKGRKKKNGVKGAGGVFDGSLQNYTGRQRRTG